MSDKSSDTQVMNDLQEILKRLGPLYGNAGLVVVSGEAAEMLSKIAGRLPAWSWRYVRSVLSGTVTPGRDFGRAAGELRERLAMVEGDIGRVDMGCLSEKQRAAREIMRVLGVAEASSQQLAQVIEILNFMER